MTNWRGMNEKNSAQRWSYGSRLLAGLFLLRVCLLVVYGPIVDTDGQGYIDYADFIREDLARWWTGSHAGVASAEVPLGVWLRLWGLPIIIAGFKSVFGAAWGYAFVLAQSALSVFALSKVLQVCRALNLQRWLRWAVVAVAGTTTLMAVDLSILTDGLYASVFTCVVATAFLDVLKRRALTIRALLWAGAGLAFMGALRESALYCVLIFLPVAVAWIVSCGRGTLARRALQLGLLLLPFVAVTTATKCWNQQRIGAAVLSTGGMSAHL